MTVDELIEILEKYRDQGALNGVGDRVIDGSSVVTMINNRAPDDYWITPVQKVDVDCFAEGAAWIVTLEVDDVYGLQSSSKFMKWLDGEVEDFKHG